STAELFLRLTLSRMTYSRMGAKVEIGSSGWTRTSNPPVNSIMQVFGLAGSRAGSSDESVLLRGVRRKIGQRLASRPGQPRSWPVVEPYASKGSDEQSLRTGSIALAWIEGNDRRRFRVEDCRLRISAEPTGESSECLRGGIIPPWSLRLAPNAG